jgi:hypothetical protein
MRSATLSAVSILLVLLIPASTTHLWAIPAASALGCAPLSLHTDGPYKSSLQGVVGLDNETVGPWIKRVYIVEPDSSVKMTFSVIFNMEGLSERRTVMPHLYFFEGTPSDISWLNVSFTPSTVILAPYQERTNVTVTLNISKDAPQPSEYGLSFELGIPSGGSCTYGGGDFILRIGRETPTHVFTLSYLPSSLSNSFGGARVLPIVESGQIKSLQINLVKGSSAKVNLNLSSQYPNDLFFDMGLTNSSSSPPRNINVTTSEFTSTEIKGLNVRMDLVGIIYDQGRYPLSQHRSGNVSFTFEANGTVKEGTYSLSLKIDAYPIPVWFNNPKIESVQIPIALQIAKNASTTLTTSTETIADSSTYTWAIGATVAAVILALVLLLRRSKS